MAELPRYLRGGSNYFDKEAWDFIVKQTELRRPGRPLSKKAIARRQASRKRNAEKRRYQVWAGKAHKRSEAWRHAIETRGRARWHILAAMEPGAWYGLDDVAALSGVPRKTCDGKVYQHLIPEGLVTKAANPAWSQLRTPGGQRVANPEPRWLFALTPDAGPARAAAIAELEARGRPRYALDKKDPPAG